MHFRVAFILLSQFLWALACAQSNAPFQPRDGFLNAETWDFDTKKLALNGRWIYYDNQLLTPGQPGPKSRVTRAFPLAWTEANRAGGGTGFATYELDVLVPAAYTELALELPQMYCSYQVWLNGKSIATCGRPGQTPEETLPVWLTQVVSFNNPGDTLHITLQVANFHHNIGGVREPVYLGTPSLLHRGRTLALYSTLAEVTFLFLEAVLFLAIFMFSQKKKVVLYFALLCLSWAVRSSFSNLYLVTVFHPGFDWAWMVRIEYMALFFTTIFGVMFLHELFNNVSNQTIKYMLVFANIFFLLFTLFSSPLVFTRWLAVYLSVSFMTLVYGVVIVVRGVLQEQKGGWYLVSGIGLGLFVFGYDLFSYKEAFEYNYLVMNLGYISIFLLVTLSLLLHLNIIKSKQKSVLTYEDLYREKKG